MPESGKTLIMKFGGAAVETTRCFQRIASLIIRRLEEYPNIVVVVSAMGDMTNQLISLAGEVNPSPPRREYDMLVSVGERISISLLAMALASKGRDAVSFTGSQSGIITCSSHSEARIIAMRPVRLLPSLREGKVVIVAGFQGVSEEKEITTLGRGGSDTTAVALGIALGAEKVEFYKDVEGIYDANPNTSNQALLQSRLDYERALEIVEGTGGQVLHARAIALAAKNGMPLHIRSFLLEKKRGTLICSPNPIEKREPVYER